MSGSYAFSYVKRFVEILYVRIIHFSLMTKGDVMFHISNKYLTV